MIAYIFFISRTRLLLRKDTLMQSSVFERIVELQLNDTMLLWRETQEIISLMPKLKHLELGYNELHDLSPASGDYLQPHLTSLNLTTNHLNDWRHVCESLVFYKTCSAIPSFSPIQSDSWFID
jgi:hypothetical protein